MRLALRGVRFPGIARNAGWSGVQAQGVHLMSALMKHLVNGETFTLEQYRAASAADRGDVHFVLSGPNAYPGGRTGSAVAA